MLYQQTGALVSLRKKSRATLTGCLFLVELVATQGAHGATLFSSSPSPEVNSLFSLQGGEVALQGHFRLWGKSLSPAGPCCCKLSLSSSPALLPPFWVCQQESLGLFSSGSKADCAWNQLSNSSPCSSPFPWPPAPQPDVSGGSVPGHTFHGQVPHQEMEPGHSWRLRPFSLQQPQLGGGTQSATPRPYPSHHCPQGCLGRLGAGCCFSWPCPHPSASLVGSAPLPTL